MDAALTVNEFDALARIGEAWTAICLAMMDAGGDDPYPGDANELRPLIHTLQNAILANAAARAYPTQFRLSGAKPPWNPPPDPD